jgi:hypothetical protein
MQCSDLTGLVVAFVAGALCAITIMLWNIDALFDEREKKTRRES